MTVLLEFPSAWAAFNKWLWPEGLYVSMFETTPEGCVREIPGRVFVPGLRVAKRGEVFFGKATFNIEDRFSLAGFLLFKDAKGGSPVCSVDQDPCIDARPGDIIDGNITMRFPE